MSAVVARGAVTRVLRRAFLVVLPVAVVGGALLVARQARVRAANDLSVSCYGNLGATTYPGGVATASLASSSAVQVLPGTGLQLNTALVPFNAQHIVFPFDQEVDIKYVYRNAGASHSFGWFYFDQIAPFLDPSGNLVDADGDGILDWFQTKKLPTRPNDGLWHITSGATPDLLNSALGYSDGGAYPHMPNLLEALTGPGRGQMVFKLCDDDGDTNAYGVGPNAGTSPINDVSTTSDGIPDYDVNGDGIVGNEPDRTVDLGIIQGNREIVFFAMTYYASSLPKRGLGTSTAGSTNVSTMPFFTKNILNPDRGTLTPGRVLQKVAIGCSPIESGNDFACWTPLGGTNGWMTPAAAARLNTLTYNNTVLAGDRTVVPITVAADGSAPHFVVFPPASNPNLWLIGYEDLPNNVGDNDYNDVVIMVERINGGQVVSKVISTDIPPAQQATTAISKIHVTYAAAFPSPGCDGVAAQVKLFYSVDGGTTWVSIPEASLTSGDLTIDVLGAGHVGSQLKWRADFVSPVQTCQPILTSFNMGYEAISNGVFKYDAPIPLSNVIYSGALETPPFPATEPAPTANDFSERGHFLSTQLYDPTNPNVTAIKQDWDGGPAMSAQSPDARAIVTSVGGVTTAFSTANAAALYPLILPAAARAVQYSAALVYDFNGDGVADDVDAAYLLQWTRGWQYPAGITFSPAPAMQPLARAWKLGAVHNSSPSVVGPPVRPRWIDGSAAPPALVAKHGAFEATYATRPTRAVVGAQDGMIHAFDAGQYRPLNDPTCTATLNRGCYAGGTDAVRYGTGAEVWAWLPPSELSQLKNNLPATSHYLPGSNPHAEVDGSIATEDVWDPALAGGGFRTVAFASQGTTQRYVTAVDMTTDAPHALWARDFTDSDFNGSDLSPSVGLAQTGPTTASYRQLLVVSSGLSSLLDDEFVYFVDALSGALVQKVQLDTAPYATQSYGIASYVNLVDSNLDGLVDRVYAADTSGRIWKIDTTTYARCLVGSVGESVFAGMATTVTGSAGAPKVELFLGGGPNPDGTGAVLPQYHAFAYEDRDPVGACSNGAAQLVYTVALQPGDKVWAAPFVGGTSAFFATANAPSVSICANGSGNLLQLSTSGDGSGNPAAVGPTQAIGGAPISSLRVYDGHALVNTVGGSTAILGGSVWNNAATGQLANGGTVGAGLINAMRTLLWQEF